MQNIFGSGSSSSRSRTAAKFLILSLILILWFLYIYRKIFFISSVDENGATGTSPLSSSTGRMQDDRDRKRSPRPESSEWKKWHDGLADIDNEPIPVKNVISWASFVKLKPSSKMTSARMHMHGSTAGATSLDPPLQFHTYEPPIILPSRCAASTSLSPAAVTELSSSLSSSCDGSLSEAYMSAWQRGADSSLSLCEAGADSAITALAQPGRSSASSSSSSYSYSAASPKFYVFENAMKMRENSVNGRREWENAFLSLSCGSSAPEDIPGLPLYYPDITDQFCDYVFTEPVLVVSPDSRGKTAKNLVRESLAMYAALLLEGKASLAGFREVTLLNIHDLPMASNPAGKAHRRHVTPHDRNEWELPGLFTFRPMFRRVLGASDFPPKQRLCFKRLLWMQRPPPLLPWSGNAAKSRNAGAGAGAGVAGTGASTSTSGACSQQDGWGFPRARGSEIFRSWNLHTRQSLSLPSTSTSTLAADTTSGSADSPSERIASTPLHVVITVPSGPGSRGALYEAAVKQALEDLVLDLALSSDWVRVTAVDFTNTPLSEQVVIASAASIIVGTSDQNALYLAAYMPFGTAMCCGIVEISPKSAAAAAASNTYGALASFIGAHHTLVASHADAAEGTSGSAAATAAGMDILPPTAKEVGEAVLQNARQIYAKPSCV